VLDVPFVGDELDAALASCRDGSPGIDGIVYRDIRQLNAESQAGLLRFFNEVWLSGEVPEAWKVAVLIPVPKAGKDRSLISSYRPIALQSCVLKVFERMVNKRLQWFLEKEHCFHGAQFGFRQGRSAQDAVLLLETGIREAWIKGLVVLAVFLDIKAAYDTVAHSVVLSALGTMGLSDQVVCVIRALLTGRRFVTRAGGACSAPSVAQRGLPQGSCLSPLLFAAFLNGLIALVAPCSNIAAYADDVALWLVGGDLTELVVVMQQVVALVEVWLQDRGMELSSAKSQVVVFSRRGPHVVSLVIGGQQICSSSRVRYLGVWLDYDLSCSRRSVSCVTVLLVALRF
jgi:potassium voltage-gated channel Eag-related subfamily H protein 8